MAKFIGVNFEAKLHLVVGEESRIRNFSAAGGLIAKK
jgi:hypothetical protein